MKTTSTGNNDRTIARLEEQGVNVKYPLIMLQSGVQDIWVVYKRIISFSKYILRK